MILGAAIRRPLVIIESPLRGASSEERAANLAYLKMCLRDSYGRGERPFASHALYPTFLDDDNPVERKDGIHFGYSLWDHASIIAFYLDRGISPGMEQALLRVTYEAHPLIDKGLKIDFRRIYSLIQETKPNANRE